MYHGFVGFFSFPQAPLLAVALLHCMPLHHADFASHGNARASRSARKALRVLHE
jgi:hypothetical protein